MVKRILSLFLGLLLLAGTAFAEFPDFASMSFEELNTMKQALDKEYLSRPEAEGVNLGEGYYVIGRDILPGNYYASMVYPTTKHDDSRMFFYETLEDFTSEEHGSLANAKQRADLKLGDKPILLSLTENEVIMIDWGNIFLKASNYDPSDYFKYEAPDGTVVPGGKYVVGKDIPVGRYEIYPASVKGGEFDLGDGGYPSHVRVFSTPEVESATLEEGDVLEVFETIVMKKSEMLKFD